MRRISLVLPLVLLLTTPAQAQSVRPIQDVASWFTAAANPTIAIWKAWHHPRRTCKLLQLTIAESMANGVSLGLKHVVVSPRPCLGCGVDGFPSGHSANSVVGLSSSWRIGLFFAVGTGELREGARRHTKTQVAAGWLVGGLSELAGQKLVRCRT